MATRILYVITKANWGGAQRYVYDLATSARDAGFEVAVAYGSSGELAERLQDAGIETFHIAGLGRDINVFSDIYSFFSLLNIIRSFKPRVVHSNSSKIGGIGALAARLTRIPKIIFTAHAWAFNEERQWYQKVSIALLAWLTVMLSKRTVVVSEAMRRQMIHAPFVRNKIKVIQNGTRIYDFLKKAEARNALIALHPSLSASDATQDMWVGSVAELHPVKGLSYAIEAIRELVKKYPALRYLIMSDGQLRTTLEAQIVKLGLEQNVFLLGYVREAPRYEKAFDLFVLPSLSEAFGISILEAGLAGVPTIATCVGGIPEIITHDETGLLVPAKNTLALASAIDSLLQDNELRTRLGTALERHVRNKFTLEQTVRQTFALY